MATKNLLFIVLLFANQLSAQDFQLSPQIFNTLSSKLFYDEITSNSIKENDRLTYANFKSYESYSIALTGSIDSVPYWRREMDKQSLFYLNRKLEQSRATASIGSSMMTAGFAVVILDLVSLLLYGSAPINELLGDELYWPLTSIMMGGGVVVLLYGTSRANYFERQISRMEQRLTNYEIIIQPPHYKKLASGQRIPNRFTLGIRVSF